MLVPSCCKLLAVVWGKEKTKRLKQRELPLGVSGKCLPDARILQRNCSPVHFPHLSPPQKKYEGLLSITIDYYWKSSYLLIYLLPYFSHWINAFKGKTSDVVIFKQITDSLRPFLSIRTVTDFCLWSCKSHPKINEKFISTMGQFSRTGSLLFKNRGLSCTLDLIDLVMQIKPF